ncbi:MAG TPA: hypothetical protein VF831_09760, partial [Anaerolineales bacterium]
FFNDKIGALIIAQNGGANILQAKGNQITFTSSLLAILPILELVILTILLWRRGISEHQADNNKEFA